MALFDTGTGLGNLFSGMNIWGTRLPTYLSGTPAVGTTEAVSGLLTDTEQEKLKNQALLQGGLGAIATYLAQPKNQGYGSALPYIGKAYLGGMQASQGAYDQATQNLLTQGKLMELKRETENAKILKQYQNEILNDEQYKDNKLAKALIAKGDIKGASEILSPKLEGIEDKYAAANYGKPFKNLNQQEQKDVLKLVQEDKKANATQINFSQPITAINPKTGKAELVQFPNKPGEKPIFTGIEKPESEVKLKPIPSGPATAYAENNVAMKAIDDAIAKVEKAPENTFGLKNYLPGAITQRIDPAGVDARSAIAAIGSKKYHDLSGAAVTITEAPRMAPFIPSSSDTKEKILQNLKNIKVQYEDTNNSLSSIYNQDQGYKPLNVSPNVLTQSTQPTGMPKTGDVISGYKFKGGNPADQKNWEKM